jgi:ketosteroid isomerase-like protein
MWESVRGMNIAAIDWGSEASREMIGEHYSPDVELKHHATGLETRTYRGRDGAFQWLREWLEPFTEYYAEAVDYVEVGDRVVVPTRQWGVGEASGARVELEITFVYEFREDQMIRITDYDTLDEALAAASAS